MLTWVDGRRDLGCTYRKTGKFRLRGISGEVDVFVRPADLHQRPIAVTVTLFGSGARKPKIREALPSTFDPHRLRPRLLRGVSDAGVPEPVATGIVDDVVALIRLEAAAIEAALDQARKK